MGTTVPISLTDSAWTEVSESVVAGTITNRSQTTAIIAESISNPGASVAVGHRLHPAEDMQYTLMGTFKVWARMKKGNGKVIVTPIG